MEILLSKAKPSTQLNRRFEVSTCRHVSPSTSIAHYNETYKNYRLRSVYFARISNRLFINRHGFFFAVFQYLIFFPLGINYIG